MDGAGASAGAASGMARAACLLFLWLPQLLGEGFGNSQPEQVHLSYPGELGPEKVPLGSGWAQHCCRGRLAWRGAYVGEGSGLRGPFRSSFLLLLPTGVPSAMTVTWTTFDPAESVVNFGLDSGKALTQWARGSARKFVDGGKLARSMFIHRVSLSGLSPGQRYGKGGGEIPALWSYGVRLQRTHAAWALRNLQACRAAQAFKGQQG